MTMILVLCLIAVGLTQAVTLVKPNAADDAAEAFKGLRVCLDRLTTRNARDVYANPDDCHTYYRCYYANDSHAVGVKHHCAPRHFWSPDVMQCVPEGRLPCMDQCRNGSFAEQGCYTVAGGRNCAKFFKCVDGMSQQHCCSNGMRFNPSTCSCELDSRNPCQDKCSLPTQVEKTRLSNNHFGHHLSALGAAQTSQQVQHMALDDVTHNMTHCQDQFGNVLEVVPTHPDSFVVVQLSKRLTARGQKPPARFSATCPKGSLFDVRSCKCRQIVAKPVPQVPGLTQPQDEEGEHKDHEEDENETKQRQCMLYLPLDDDYEDHSFSKNVAYLYDEVELSQTFAARGEGSLLLQGGRLEIPNFSRVDFRDSASFCLFFQCASRSEDPHASRDPFSCDAAGGLLSNRVQTNGIDYAISLSVQPDDQVSASFAFEHPEYVATINSSVNFLGFGFNQVCVTYDSTFVTLYVNNILMAKTPAAGFVRSGFGVYSLGTDGFLGSFHGYIDEVLICRHAMTQNDVNAHFKGHDALRAAGLVP